jgi:hypothetical protein
MTILQYVQVENDVALIDSRVYCRDIIEVVYKDWMYDTYRKHLLEVEELFGVVRFETDKPIKGSIGGRPEGYALIAASRTVRGIDVEQIGQTVTLDWDYYCRVNKALKTPKNALFLKACFIFKNGHTQLTLNLGA